MSELFRTRCVQGWLVITEEAVRIELPGQIHQRILYRSALTGIESKVGAISIFGLGGGTNLTFHAGIETLHADLVKPGVAREIVAMLQKPTPRP